MVNLFIAAEARAYGRRLLPKSREPWSGESMPRRIGSEACRCEVTQGHVVGATQGLLEAYRKDKAPSLMPFSSNTMETAVWHAVFILHCI